MRNMEHTAVDDGPMGQNLSTTDALLLGIKNLPG